jgi:hypothetical protein
MWILTVVWERTNMGVDFPHFEVENPQLKRGKSIPTFVLSHTQRGINPHQKWEIYTKVENQRVFFF